MTLASALAGAAAAQEHGIGITQACQSACVGDNINCTFTGIHEDGFGW